jgi:hypothetical protein
MACSQRRGHGQATYVHTWFILLLCQRWTDFFPCAGDRLRVARGVLHVIGSALELFRKDMVRTRFLVGIVSPISTRVRSFAGSGLGRLDSSNPKGRQLAGITGYLCMLTYDFGLDAAGLRTYRQQALVARK